MLPENRFSPWILPNFDDYEDEKPIWLGIEISLSKRHNDISCLSTCIYFNFKKKDRYEILTEAYNEEGEPYRFVKYKRKDLTFEEYSNQVIATWKKWLQ